MANHVQHLADFPGLLGQGLHLLQGRAGIGAHGLHRRRCSGELATWWDLLGNERTFTDS
jgi:hypothetical protein